VLPALSVSDVVVAGEVEVLLSRKFAEEVIDDLKLYTHPEFNEALAADDGSFVWSDLRDYWLNWVVASARDLVDGSETTTPVPTDQRAAADLQKGIVDHFLEQISVEQVGQSPVLQISFTSEDAETAAMIANTAAEIYVNDQLARKYEASRRVSNWLAGRIKQLRTEVESKERDIEQFRARSGLIAGAGRDGGQVTVVKQQIAELASDLIKARVDREGADSQLQQVERLLKSPKGIDSAVEVLQSPLIQNLRIEEAQQRRELAELAGEYGPKHPRVTTATAKLGNIEQSIRIEINKIVQGLRNQVETARRREAALQESLDALKKKVADADTQDVELRARERDADASRTLLQNFLARAQETTAQEGIQQPDARIISSAVPPEFPSFPKKWLFMAVAFCASAFAGVSVAYVLEALDQSFHTARQVRDHLGLPVLELIPSVRKLGRKLSPIDCVIKHPNSSFTEALRNLQVTMYGSNYPPKTVLFTSSLPGEGKTSLVLSLGRLLALSDRSVVVLDCDLRKSAVHGALGCTRAPGLVEHLLGRATLEEIIRTEEATAMHYVTAGARTATNPSTLLAMPALRTLLSRLEHRFDAVLIDCPPMLAVVDARCLQPLVEQTVFVVRWRSTQRASAREAVRRVREAGLGVAGIVLNAVDPKEYSRYDEGYYYDAVRTYYED
jgi:succinoglycan biosynthesis transport protein ExoP